MNDELLASVWGPLVWAVLYTSDYYLTIACARLYQAQSAIVFSGSYEITPMFQEDVNALRRVSPRFLFFLVVSTTCLLLMRGVARLSSELFPYYLLVFGGLILVEATVHIRHLRNWYMFRHGVPVLKGRVEYPRGLLLRASAFEFAVFAGLYACLYLVTAHPFLLGGVFACGLQALGHYNLAKRPNVAGAA
jgi:hypothetical protein